MGNITSIRKLLVGAALALLAGCASTPRSGGASEFASPLEETYQVTSFFGERRGRPHYGIDLNARRGTAVFASADGRVSFAGRQRGFGKIVIIDHPDGFQTYYAHLSEIAVREDKKVRSGDRVGRVGATGNATGPHLHFELRQNGVPLDPMAHIRP